VIKEKYNQWHLSYQIGRIITIGYIHKLAIMQYPIRRHNK